jgi:hypothetical protein
MNSIHSFRGIPAGAFSYDRISILQAAVVSRDAIISRLMSAGSAGGGGGSGGGGSGGGNAAGASVDASRVLRPTIGPDRDYSGWKPRRGVDWSDPNIVVGPNGTAIRLGPPPDHDGGCLAGRNPNGSCRAADFVRDNAPGWGVACGFGLFLGSCPGAVAQSIAEDAVTHNLRQHVFD